MEVPDVTVSQQPPGGKSRFPRFRFELAWADSEGTYVSPDEARFTFLYPTVQHLDPDGDMCEAGFRITITDICRSLGDIDDSVYDNAIRMLNEHILAHTPPSATVTT